MKRAKAAPFEARPARPRKERVERAVKRQVDDLVEICKAMSTGMGLGARSGLVASNIMPAPRRNSAA